MFFSTNAFVEISGKDFMLEAIDFLKGVRVISHAPSPSEAPANVVVF